MEAGNENGALSQSLQLDGLPNDYVWIAKEINSAPEAMLGKMWPSSLDHDLRVDIVGTITKIQDNCTYALYTFLLIC